MTIDRRRKYYRRRLYSPMTDVYGLNRRVLDGEKIKQELKHYWHLIDQGKPQS